MYDDDDFTVDLDGFDWFLIAFSVSCLLWVVIGTIALAVMG